MNDTRKWEYCVVRGFWLGGEGRLYTQQPCICYFTPDGPEYAWIRGGREDVAVARKLAELGEEGWEMCGVVLSGQPTVNVLFKRPKQ